MPAEHKYIMMNTTIKGFYFTILLFCLIQFTKGQASYTRQAWQEIAVKMPDESYGSEE
jgi:hypothetical protein